MILENNENFKFFKTTIRWIGCMNFHKVSQKFIKLDLKDFAQISKDSEHVNRVHTKQSRKLKRNSLQNSDAL